MKRGIVKGMANTQHPRRFHGKRGLSEDREGSVGGTVLKVLIALFIILVVYYYNIRLMDFLMSGLAGYEEIPEYSEFTLDRILTIKTEGSPIHAKLTIPYPEDISVTTTEGDNEPIQEIVDVKAEPRWDRIETDKWGDQTMVWEMDIPAGKEINIVITYSVVAYSAKWDINSGNSGTVDDIPQAIKDKYCHNEWRLDPEENARWDGLGWRIAPTNDTISSLAHKLADDKPTVYSKLKALYDYMNANFEYQTGNPGLPKNCIQTLEEKTGDCDDQSILFISMARALGIPAWLEGGALYNFRSSVDYNADGLPDAWEGHAWANVYIPLEGGDFMIATVDVVNDLFLIRDTNRFSEWMDDGNTERLEDYYSLWEYTYSGTSAPSVTTSEYYLTEEWKSYGSRDNILKI